MGGKFIQSIVTSDMLVGWRSKYGIPSLVELVVPEPSDRVDVPPIKCVALNSAILSAGLRVSFPRIMRKLISFWDIAPTQLCPNG